MKNIIKNFQNYSVYLGILFLSLSLSSCSNDDDAGEIDQWEEATATLEVGDQTISQNTVIIDRVTVAQDSWLVVRNVGSENSAEIVSDPVFLTEGTHENVEVTLNEEANLTGDEAGDELVVMIHIDDPNAGNQGEFDYNGQNGADMPITDDSGTIIRGEITATAPSLYADDDQTVTENDEVTFTSVNTGATGGYVGLYGQNEDGTINENELIGVSDYIEPGENENVTAQFFEDYDYRAGETIYPRLFTDNPTDQNFTYESSDRTEDLPETYGYDPGTGEGRYVVNAAPTVTPGAFTINNSRAGTDTSTAAGTGI